jgi:hypothetical protein
VYRSIGSWEDKSWEDKSWEDIAMMMSILMRKPGQNPMNSITEIESNEVSQVSKLSFLFFYQISVWLSDPSLDQRPIGTKSDTEIQGLMSGKQVGFNSWLFSI